VEGTASSRLRKHLGYGRTCQREGNHSIDAVE
jgi:hypothetical protein